MANRTFTTSSSLAKTPSEPTPPSKDAVSSGGSSSGSGGGKKNMLTCPKCGDPCTHVETFVCKCNSAKYKLFLYI